MVDITNTLVSQEKLTDQFTEQYNALILIQQNHVRNTEQESNNLTNNKNGENRDR